jgi:hypothetical protein
MYVSEDTFVHLHQAAEERQRRELEYRRIAQERDAETDSTTGSTARSTAGSGLRQLVQKFHRPGHSASRRLSHP